MMTFDGNYKTVEQVVEAYKENLLEEA